MSLTTSRPYEASGEERRDREGRKSTGRGGGGQGLIGRVRSTLAPNEGYAPGQKSDRRDAFTSVGTVHEVVVNVYVMPFRLRGLPGAVQRDGAATRGSGCPSPSGALRVVHEHA